MTSPAGSRVAPISVLLLCESLGITGGVERFVCEIGNALAARGMSVTLGNVDTGREGVVYPLDAAVRVVAGGTRLADDAPRTRPGRGLAMLRTRWRVGRALGRIIDAEAPDVIVLNGLVTACSVLAWKREARARSICCDHNHFTARSKLWQRLRAAIYPQVGAVVSLTEADRPRFAALNRETRVIANSSSLHADAPALPAAPRVLAVGRHVAQKGFDLLLGAWQQVVRELPAARLRIVGDGPLGGDLAGLATELGVAGSVDWTAPTGRIEALYREAAVFVLSSRYEGMPLALLEAQALGVPAVAFDCPTGPREIVGAETGFVVPCEDVEAMARAIVRLLRDPALRARMAHAAIARSRAMFSRERQVDAWAALIGAVATRASLAGVAR
ncbi:MAG: glycosyltransferase family 4 protein [Caldimonas sp.]